MSLHGEAPIVTRNSWQGGAPTDCCIQNRTQIVFLSFPLLLYHKLVLTTMADRRCWYDIPYAANIMFVGRP